MCGTNQSSVANAMRVKWRDYCIQAGKQPGPAAKGHVGWEHCVHNTPALAHDPRLSVCAHARPHDLTLAVGECSTKVGHRGGEGWTQLTTATLRDERRRHSRIQLPVSSWTRTITTETRGVRPWRRTASVAMWAAVQDQGQGQGQGQAASTTVRRAQRRTFA